MYLLQNLLQKFLIGIMLTLVISLPGQATADSFAKTQNFAGHNLTLNGKGVRTKLFFKLYTAGLYLQKPSSDAKELLSGKHALALRMEITSAMITSETMESAVRDGFRISAGDQQAKLQPRIDQLIKIFNEKINKGDIYDFIYRPQNVIIQKNGKTAGTIPGVDFMQAFYAIWLGDKPVQADLKAQLLSAQ